MMAREILDFEGTDFVYVYVCEWVGMFICSCWHIQGHLTSGVDDNDTI